MELKKQTAAGEIKMELQGTDITIREGRAAEPLPLKEPVKIALSGDIHTVANFLQPRLADKGHSLQEVLKDRAIVTVDKTGRTILLQLDPESHYGTTVSGKLTYSNELAAFGINENKRYERKALADLIKFSRLYFKDKQRHAEVMASLYKLRIKSTQELQQEQDNAGNRKNSVEVSVIDDGGFNRFFNLHIPIFQGFPAQNIEVEICYEVMDGKIAFWLESVGLKETADSQVDEIFETELKAADGFVTIYK